MDLVKCQDFSVRHLHTYKIPPQILMNPKSIRIGGLAGEMIAKNKFLLEFSTSCHAQNAQDRSPELGERSCGSWKSNYRISWIFRACSAQAVVTEPRRLLPNVDKPST